MSLSVSKVMDLKNLTRGTNDNTGATEVAGLEGYHLVAVFGAGSGTGKVRLEASIDAENWSAIPDSEVVYPPTDGSNNVQYIVNDVNYKFVRLALTEGATPGGTVTNKLMTISRR